MTTLIKPFNLSSSGADCLQTCERKYAHRYFLKTPFDGDYVDGPAKLRGSAFHKILELTNHDQGTYNHSVMQAVLNDFPKLCAIEDCARLQNALRQYWKLRMLNPRRVVARELSLTINFWTGVIDCVMERPDGTWIIQDQKTRGKCLDDEKEVAGWVRSSQQMCLYAKHAHDIAAACGLDASKFAGIILVEIEMPRIRKGKNESSFDFAQRLNAEPIKAREVFVPAHELKIDEVVKNFEMVRSRAHELQAAIQTEGLACAKQNKQNCKKYFEKCPYWSKCYGDAETTGDNYEDVL